MNYRLRDLLEEVPDDIFFQSNGRPDFNAIFVEVARIILGEETDEFTIHSSEFLSGNMPNLTSFQRSVPIERKRRRG